MNKWEPIEIIVHEEVKNDPATTSILSRCPNVSVKYVNDSKTKSIINASKILQEAKTSMLDTIIAGKQVMFIAPASKDVVQHLTMPDDRMICPHFERVKFAANGCFYQCDWCYLKGTYRAAFPYITVRAQYDEIKKQLQHRLDETTESIMFSSGEVADSLPWNI